MKSSTLVGVVSDSGCCTEQEYFGHSGCEGLALDAAYTLGFWSSVLFCFLSECLM